MDIYHQLLLNDARSKKDSLTCTADPEVLRRVNSIHDSLTRTGTICPSTGNQINTDPMILQKVNDIIESLSPNKGPGLIKKIEKLSSKLENMGNAGSGNNDDILRRIDEGNVKIMNSISSKDGDNFIRNVKKDKEQVDTLRILLTDITKIQLLTKKEVKRVSKSNKTSSLYNIIHGKRGEEYEFTDKIKTHFFHLMMTSSPLQNTGLLSGVTGPNITSEFISKLYGGIRYVEPIRKVLVDTAIDLELIVNSKTDNDSSGIDYITVSNEFVARYPILVLTYLYQYHAKDGKIVPKNKTP